jgi:hypothetical protein
MKRYVDIKEYQDLLRDVKFVPAHWADDPSFIGYYVQRQTKVEGKIVTYADEVFLEGLEGCPKV